MERSSRGYGPNIPGQVPAAASSTPLIYNNANNNFYRLSNHLPLSRPHYPIPNFKIRMNPPSYESDRTADNPTLLDRPQKRRKIENESAGRVSSSPQVVKKPPRTLSSDSVRRGSEDGSYLPFPARRPRITTASTPARRAPPRPSLINDTIVYGATPSSEEATRYPDDLADLKAWEGIHPEDNLSENGIRNGFYEKVPNQPVELATSKPLMLSALKMSGAVDALSQMLASCVARRAEIATVSSYNAFKPPPRVTLTDTRREAWLKELACENVPLRRLNKTIPHGIRGKPLLDQCLAKLVPVWRAIWLIKCVGSNEIRAFRRRGACSQVLGTCGETKWVREWTESVVETLTATVQDTAHAKHSDVSRQRLVYLLALVRKIYDEDLLDRDVFQAGIINHFNAAKTPDAMVTWMAIVAPYATDALKYCHRGRQLLQSLLEKGQHLSAAGTDARLAGLLAKCTTMASDILRRFPQCAVLAQEWSTFQPVLSKLVDDEESQLDRCVDRLDLQNSLVDHQTKLAVDQRFPNPSAAVIALCDQRAQVFEPSKLLASCQKLVPDASTLSETVLQWSISPCRPGMRSIYMTARLLRLLHKSGHDFQEQVLNLLDSVDEMDGDSSRRLCRLVTELVRSKHFSVSKYLQRRMVRGLSTIKQEHLEILAFLPPQTIPPEVANLAANLCEHAGCSYMVSPTDISTNASKLEGLFLKSGASSGFASDAHAFITSLAPNMRHALALHVRREMASRRDQQAYPSPDDHRMDIDTNSFYAPPHSIITVFELVEDMSLFADVLLMMIPGSGADILRAIIRCTICHQDTFQAMGATDPVAKAIMKQYGTLWQQDIRDKDLVLALVDLMRTVSCSERTFTILNDHMSTIQAEKAGIAPSPISDQMVDVLQSSEIRSLSDLESFLQSGNVLEETVLQKILKYLFRVMMSNMRDTEQVVNALKILSCVKGLNEDAFTRLLHQWLEQIFQSEDLRIAIQIVPWIIAGGLISIVEVVKFGKERMAAANKKTVAAGLALNVFVATLKSPGPEFLNSIEHYYTLKAAQNSFVLNEPAMLASLIGLVLEASKSPNESIAKRAKQLTCSNIFETIFLATLCSSKTSSSHLLQELSRLKDQGVQLSPLLTRVLKCEDKQNEFGQSASASGESVMKRLAHKVDYMNLVPCQLLAQLHLSELPSATSEERDSLYQHAAEVMVDADSHWLEQLASWNHLLIGVDPAFVAVLHDMALKKIITSVADLMHNTFKPVNGVLDETSCLQLLSILEATQTQLTQQQNTAAFEHIHGIFIDLVAIIDNTDINAEVLSSAEKCVCSIARLAGMHLRQPQAGNIPHEKVLMLCIMLAKSLSMIHEAKLPSTTSHNPPLRIPTCGTEAVLETVLVHASSMLSDEMRAKCLGAIHAQLHHTSTRIDFLLGRDDPKSAVSQYLLVTDDSVNSPISLAGTDSQSSGTPDTTMHDSASLEPSIRPFSVDPWETLQDASASSAPDDACVDLALFGTQKLVI